MRKALGDAMSIAANFDAICLVDKKITTCAMDKYSWLKSLLVEYVKKYGQRVLKVALKDNPLRFLYTPFSINTSSCNPSILCKQLIEIADKNNYHNILFPMPDNWDDIKDFVSLDDRFIFLADDARYMTKATDTPNLEDTYSTTLATVNPDIDANVNPIASLGCCVTGHRPKSLYGYHSDKWTTLQNKIYACCKQLYEQFGIRRFGSGCAQGVDMCFFYCVDYLVKVHPDVQNILYRPFPTHGSNFPMNGSFGRTEYDLMLSKATEIKELNQNAGTDSRSIREALLKRNEIMIDDNEYVIGVFNGDESYITNNISMNGGTLHALRYAYSKGKKIILINPNTFEAKRFNF